MATAFSYIRFSSDKQVKGDSLRRQEQLIADWVENNPEIPLSAISYRDLGISGYTGKHLDCGLGQLLAAVDSCHIAAGDIILIESIDRVGRLPIEEMLPILLSMVKHGITIITLEDGTKYNKQSINDGNIFVLAGKTQAAHAYSKQLSNRLLKARTETRNNVIAGKLKKITSHCPWWIEWSDDKNDWIELEAKINIVQLIFDMYINGDGITKIVRHLNKYYPEGHSKAESNKGSTTTKLNRGWHTSAVNRCLFDRRAIGEVTSKGEQLPNYYPKVISISTYQSAKAVNSKKVAINSKGNDKVKPPLHMFHDLVYCTCGELCTYQNKGGGLFMFTCKKRVRGLCSASSSLNTQLIDTHIRPFIHAIEHDKLVKISQYTGPELQTNENIISVPLDSIIIEKQEAYRRSLKAYTSGLIMPQDEDEELLRISKLKSEIRDMEMQQKEATDEQLIVKDFNINDLLNTNISGFTCNLFLKVHRYRITIHNNGVSILTGRYCFNDKKLDLLRIKKKGKSLKGSISKTIFTSSPTLKGGVYNSMSIFPTKPKTKEDAYNYNDKFTLGKKLTFIDVDNKGKKLFYGNYLVNNTGEKEIYRASFTKESTLFNYGENNGWTYIDGVGYAGLSLAQKINQN
jgi:DNA invertase Pin-like site-specific DNA recombinase